MRGMKFINQHYKIILFSIPLFSLALHFHVFSLDLIGIHVWRQTETQTVINNFYSGDFNILNPRVNGYADTNQLHRMEFPVMQWLIALLYKIFGQHIYITRATVFIIGLFSVYGMFYLCQGVFKNKGIGSVCAWCFNWSPVFYYYTVNPMPDNFALCCAIWCIAFFYAYINTDKIKYIAFSAVFLCIATLAKLPFIIYGSFVFSYIAIALIRKTLPVKNLLKIITIYALCLVPALSWYAWVVPGWANGAIKGIFDQTLNHPNVGHVITGTIVSVLPELLVNYGSLLFFLAGFYLLYRNKVYKKTYFPLFAFWGITLIAYFLYEVNMIDLVHDYYLFPFLPPIFLLIAYSSWWLLAQGRFLRTLSVICLLVLPITAFVRADSRWDTKDPGFNPAYLKYRNELRRLTPPGSLCITYNDCSSYILLYYIDRKGWSVNENYLDPDLLSSYVSKGASYLFLDTQIDTFAGIKAHLGEKMFDKETLRVYKLK